MIRLLRKLMEILSNGKEEDLLANSKRTNLRKLLYLSGKKELD